MRQRSSFYRTQDDEYQSLGRDAAELYLFRRSVTEANENSKRLTLFVLCSSLFTFSALLYLLF